MNDNKIVNCPKCRDRLPLWVLKCHNNMCMNCAVYEYNKDDESDDDDVVYYDNCRRCNKKFILSESHHIFCWPCYNKYIKIKRY